MRYYVASKEEYAQWIVDNQDKQGTPEFDTVVQAYKAAGVIQTARDMGAPSASGTPVGSALEAAVDNDPASRMSFPEQFAAGYGKVLPDVAYSTQQMAGMTSPEQDQARKDKDASLMASGGGMAGNLAGNMVTFGAIPGANTIKGGAAIGAGIGMLTPTAGDESRLNNTIGGTVLGGATNPLLGALKKGVGYGTRAVESYFPSRSPSLTGGALRAADSEGSDRLVEAMRNNPSLTLRQAATESQSPEIAGMVQMAEEVNPRLRDSLIRSENAAVKSAFDDVAGTGDDIANATAQRSANYEKMALQSFDEPLTMTPTLQRALDGPFVQRVLKSKDFRDTVKSKGVEEGTTEYFHLIKKGMDDLLDTAKEAKLGGSAKGALQDEQRAFIREIGKANPAYDRARIGFELDSAPINQMEVGTALRQKAITPNMDINPNTIEEINPNPLLTALRNGDSLAKKTTGFKGSTLQGALGGMTEDVTAIGNRVAQNKEFGRLAGSGRKSAGESLKASGPGQLPGILERNVVVANALLSRAGKHETESVLKFLSKNLDKPEEIARILKEASPEERVAVNGILKYLSNAAPAAVASQGIN